MKRFFLLSMLLFTLIGVAGAKESIPTFKTVTKGVEFRKVLLDLPRPLTVYQLRCDPRLVKFHLLLASDGKRGKTATAQQMVEDFSLIAAVNSSYFDTKFRILGQARRYNEVLNPTVGEGGLYTAYFYWDGRRAGLKRRGESLPSRVPVLFQCGPRLVWDSQIISGLEKKALANRTTLALDAEGRVIFSTIGGIDRVTLAELPNLLLAPVTKGGVGAVRAINLDGGKSTQLYLKTGSTTEHMPGFVEVPVFLGISGR